ncbi:response regulator transcription factor [Roseomonas genomospecies 6]|uniref:DNA-binding response regulator n=1 Tax=Roseomonas genomospecies 6 TaxID=214106 RepID=A0A9W7TY57_9PROT|nr:response regulator transcription factor [Roseomonas genomospecies 6]KAA0680600.1 DNA-binding response regulator [Roseomonas genomospecies 6]
MKVLVIDDDSELARAMQPVLKTYSIDIDAAHTPEEGLQRLRQESYDLLLLDVMLPNTNGFELCRQIRMSSDTFKGIPIIMLTARTDLTDLVVGLETGADDYVTKPFEPRELVARVHAVRRRFWERSQPAPAEEPESEEMMCFQLDDTYLVIDPLKVRVHVGRRNVVLTSMEYELLLFLSREPGQVFTRDDLIYSLQGISRICTRSIDAIVYRLRHKLRNVNPKADFIRTVRGRGYSLIGMRMASPPPDQTPQAD